MIAQRDKELERIISIFMKYTKELKMGRDEGISYLLQKMGYKKKHYIPQIYDNEDLTLIESLSWNYKRKYGISLETFIYNFIDYYEYCSLNGFQTDIEQSFIVKES